MRLDDLLDTGRVDTAVKNTITAYLRDLGETDLAAHLEQSPPPAALRFDDRMIVAVDTGLLVFSYSLPDGGGCEVAGTLTPWRGIRVSDLTMRTDWKPHMANIPRMWTLNLSGPNLTLTAYRDDSADLLAFARLCLERTATS